MTRKIQQVKFSELVPCRTAFIDTHNPGTEGKENFTIIGGGVSENPEQYVHIKKSPGFNISRRVAPIFFTVTERQKSSLSIVALGVCSGV